MYFLRLLTYALVIIGAINWGLVGFFGVDIVSAIFGEMSLLARFVYVAIGLSALILLVVNRDIYNRRCDI